MKHKINDQIQAKEIDLIDPQSGTIQRVSFSEAIKQASLLSMDLVEMAHKEDGVSVCKIMNYGKHLYNAQKTKSASVKKVGELREMRFNPSIGKEDYENKLKKIKEFLEDKSKVLISIKMKGREREHTEIAKILLDRIKTDCESLISQKNTTAAQISQAKISATLVPK